MLYQEMDIVKPTYIGQPTYDRLGLAFGTPSFCDTEVKVIHRAEASVLLLDIAGCQVDIFASHFQRRMPQDFLQAECIPSMNKISDTKSMTAGVWMEFINLSHFLHPLKHFFHCSVCDLISISI